MASYKELVWSLYRNNLLFPQVKMGLENMRALNALMGRPCDAFKTVHVAGTNGKGSVSWKVARALQASGHRTGLFVSPHLACFRERVQVDGTLISEAAVEHWMPKIIEAAREADIPATFFELTTQLAFCHFADENAEFVALETGLGGRLDSTNIVTPAVSVITSIGLDHTRVLGDTVEAIAMEKAGIIKPGVPVVLGPNAARDVILPVAQERGCPCTVVGGASQPADAWEDDFDTENTEIARAALKALGQLPEPGTSAGSAVAAALQTCPPSRFEVVRLEVGVKGANPSAGATDAGTPRTVRTSVVLDGGHNEMAFERLASRLRRVFPRSPLRFVVGMSNDKDAASVLPHVAAITGTPPDRFHFVSSVHARAASASDLAAAVGADIPAANVHAQGAYVESVGAGINQALALATSGSPTADVMSCTPVATTCATDGYSLDDAVGDATTAEVDADVDVGGGSQLPEIVVVCGSVYLMMEARDVLGFDEPRDDADAQPQASVHAGSGDGPMPGPKP